MSGPTAAGGSDHDPDPREAPGPTVPPTEMDAGEQHSAADWVDPQAETTELPAVEPSERPRRWTFRTVWDCDGPPIQRRGGLRVSDADLTTRYSWHATPLPSGDLLVLRA